MGGVNGEGGKGERLKWVGVMGAGGRKEGRKKQRAKIVGWTNGRRVLEIFKMLVGRTNGKRRMVWELRSEGG